MASFNLFTFGCADVNESDLHLCSDAVSIEKSNSAKTFFHAKPYDSLNVNPSNSTNTGTNEGQNHSNNTETDPLNWFDKVFDGSEDIQKEFVFEDEEFPNLPFDQIAYEPEKIDYDLSIPTTESFTGGEEFIVSEFNMNKMETEEESIKEETTPSNISSKPPQSQFKNKPKELLEKAVAIFKYFAGLDVNVFNAIMRENMKSPEQWIMDGEVIREMIQVFETQASNGSKQSKKTREAKNAILNMLEAKQYCSFAELYTYMQRIQQCESRVITNFNTNSNKDKKDDYKSKISQSYFKNTDFEAEDLFSWVLLLQIALVILPKSQETLELFPLKKESVFLSTWMFQSSMKQDNKDLYNGAYARNHLRKILGEAKSALMEQAEVKMEPERLALLKEVCSALNGGVEQAQRNQRPVYNVVGLRTAVNYEIMGDMTGKRSSDLCSVKSEKITKKVNKNRK